jgi:asparagine synthase (glutamine-hydrolysing)
MVHRGPDDEGVYLGEGIGLGMRRLSIIDVEGGHQPVSNEDGSIWVVLNGEIYNYRELRRELEGRGHRFRTSSDTETIVHLYEDFGAGAVERLRGMFAFAVWDGRERHLLLARDRLGIKPLYYREGDDELVFASELKAILQLTHIERTLNWEAVRHLFTFLATPSTDSVVSGIKKLEPGHVAIVTKGCSLRALRYWDVAFTPDEKSTEQELVERLRELLVDAVAAHRISDVPVGAFLSGGVDSSAIVALMAEAASTRVKTFSVGFREQPFDELHYARRVAAQFGTDHHEVILEPGVIPSLEDLAWYLDEPFGDPSAIPTFVVSKLAGTQVKVVLTGDGGDELFAGYDKYVVEGRERRYDRVPPLIRRLTGAVGTAMPDGMRGRRYLRHFGMAGSQRYLDASTLFPADEMPNLFRKAAFEQMESSDPWTASLGHLDHGSDWVSALQYRDLNTYLPLDILTKVDRMTMAHSIEARPPLLDHPLVEFAATLPAALQLRAGKTKYLFKHAVRGLLPPDIIDRPKRGFAVPLESWFRGRLVPFARDLLLSDTTRQRGYLNTSYLEKLLRRHERGRNLDLHLWTAMSFELWCRQFLDAPRRRYGDPIRDGEQLRAQPA